MTKRFFVEQFGERVEVPVVRDDTTGRILGWKCEHCGERLPMLGKVWSWRFRQWHGFGKPSSGYYCDPCADAREAGADF